MAEEQKKIPLLWNVIGFVIGVAFLVVIGIIPYPAPEPEVCKAGGWECADVMGLVDDRRNARCFAFNMDNSIVILMHGAEGVEAPIGLSSILIRRKFEWSDPILASPIKCPIADIEQVGLARLTITRSCTCHRHSTEKLELAVNASGVIEVVSITLDTGCVSSSSSSLLSFDSF